MTLGPGSYTEADVDASARAWTGHGIDDSVQPRRYVFRPTWHDNGTTTFFGTTKSWDGPAIIDEILDNPAKRTIMTVLRARLLKAKQDEHAAALSAERRSQVGGGGRSEKIRAYNFKENRVSDHRIGLTLYRLQQILAGDLDEIVEALMADERARQLAAAET